MEGQGVSLILKNLADFKSFSVIVPDTDCFISSTCAHKLLLDADVHAINTSGVEGEYEVFIFCIISWSLNIDWNPHYLIVFS